MKQIILIIIAATIISGCIHTDKTKEQKLGATLTDNATANLCPYDSAGFTPIRDTIIPKKDTTVKDSTIYWNTKDSVWKKGNWFTKAHWKYTTTQHSAVVKDTIINDGFITVKTVARDTVYTAYKACTVTATTEFGVKINSQPLDAELNIMRQLGVTWARDQEIIGSFTGVTGKNFRRYKDSGYKVALNIKEFNVTNTDGTKSAKPFPKDTVKYKQQLDPIVAAYKDADIIVIGNEPFNSNKSNGGGYYTGPISDYENELRSAVTVCHKYGVKVADGALLQHRLLAVLIYDEKYINKSADAETFASKYLLTKDINDVHNHTGVYLFADSLLQIAARVNTDYVNIHAYFPSTTNSPTPNITDPSFFELAADFLRRKTGKEVIANEVGQNNYDPQLTKDMVSSAKKAKIKLFLWWSGMGTDGADAKPLTDGNTTTLGTNGKAFSAAIK